MYAETFWNSFTTAITHLHLFIAPESILKAVHIAFFETIQVQRPSARILQIFFIIVMFETSSTIALYQCRLS